MIAEAYALHEPWLKSRFNDYGESFRDRIALGGFIRAADYVAAIRQRRILCLEMKAAMADLDILVSAAAVGEAPRITDVPKWATLEKPSFTMPFNVTGSPAISICTGYGAGGLPLSMQLIAKPFAEPLLFQAAHALTRPPRRLPALPTTPLLRGRVVSGEGCVYSPTRVVNARQLAAKSGRLRSAGANCFKHSTYSKNAETCSSTVSTSLPGDPSM